jgi:hypothetical protein
MQVLVGDVIDRKRALAISLEHAVPLLCTFAKRPIKTLVIKGAYFGVVEVHQFLAQPWGALHGDQVSVILVRHC